MPADVMLFWDDKMHEDSAAVTSLTASTTAPGYAVVNVRKADLERAWKSVDNATLSSPGGDEWLLVQGSSTAWLGATTVYCAVAYDARGSNQLSFLIQSDSLDDGTFGGVITTHGGQNFITSGVGCWYMSFASPQRKYYRLIQRGANRTGGPVTAKILRWEMHDAGTMTIMSTSFPGQSPDAWTMREIYNGGAVQAAGGLPRYATYAEPSQRFTLPFNPASAALRDALASGFRAIRGPARAIMVQFPGIYSPAKADFFMARMVPSSWSSRIVPIDQYSTTDIEMETERWR